MIESPLRRGSDRTAQIEAKLRERLEARCVEVIDESHLHVGHAGVAPGAGHFSALVVSPKFEGLSAVEAQRMVYDALAEEMKGNIHALRIKTMTG